MNNLADVQQYAERACHMYQQHGSPESGASALDKAAKILENTHPEKALQLYQRACDVVLVSTLFRLKHGLSNIFLIDIYIKL